VVTKSTLIQRWRSPAGRPMARQVLEQWRSGDPLDAGSLGRTDRGVDLRGFVLPDQSEPVTLAGAHLRELDLTYAQLPGLGLASCRLTNCTFLAANCSDWRIATSLVETCDFGKALLDGATIGAGSDGGRLNVWRHVGFTGASFRDAALLQAVFDHCDFTQAKLAKAEFRQCHFADSTFAGTLKQVIFDGRDLPDLPAPTPMRRVDFSQAVLQDVEFKSCVMESVAFPSGADHLILPNLGSVADCGMERLRNLTSTAAQELRWLLRDATHGPGFDPNSTGVFVRRDLARTGGDDLARLAFEVLPECLPSDVSNGSSDRRQRPSPC
jgi:uncharacterized protein YjbI with pentapeptide repeats